LTNNTLFDINEEEKNNIADLTKGFSGADMYNLCSEASYVPLRALHSSIETIQSSEVPLIKFSHFVEALKLVRSSVNEKLLRGFEDWNRQYGSYQLSPDELEKEE
jgi:SpoVK/Ycf46/Vps4 family AAA+-type ATPase